MELICKKSVLNGEIRIPGSKSHTIRAVVIASLAEGKSRILQPLYSDDSTACIRGCRVFGAEIKEEGNVWEVKGFSGKPRTPAKEIFLNESGTSTTNLAGVAAHAKGPTVLTGGETLRARPFEPICKGINDLGGKAESLQNTGKPPLKISGFLEGGFAEIDGMNSQPVSSLLVNSAIAKNDSEIAVVNPAETIYVEMTMRWLDEQGIKHKAAKDFTKYNVEGGQSYHSFEKAIPADWSSACFSLCAAAVTPGSEVLVKGLDFNDLQGDKEIVNILKKMGADITKKEEGFLARASELQGIEVDLNQMPDAVPIVSVVGCLAEGETRIVNVAQARIKETDRLKAMAAELKKMGANVEEREDGLIIRKSMLKGALVNGYNDHRTIMSLAIAGMNAEGTTRITTAEGINKTYPSFVKDMEKIGAKMEKG